MRAAGRRTEDGLAAAVAVDGGAVERVASNPVDGVEQRDGVVDVMEEERAVDHPRHRLLAQPLDSAVVLRVAGECGE